MTLLAIVFRTCARADGYRMPCVSIMTLQLISCVTIYITIFGENEMGRQIAKKRHITKPSTIQM